MPDAAQITLTVREDVVEKLAELAGDESRIGEYLLDLILHLHAKKFAPDGVVDLEQLVAEVHELLGQQKRYERKILNLQQRLIQMFAANRALVEALQAITGKPDRRAKAPLRNNKLNSYLM